jgi:2-dehydropantoate 2-reductase
MAQCFPTRAAANFEALQWTKLVVNINNCVNALSGQPLVRQLSDHDYRLVSAMVAEVAGVRTGSQRASLLPDGNRACAQIVAALMEEATGILARAGVKLVPLSPVLRPNVMPHILRMPNAVYLLLAQRALRIDPHAVSSMAQDLARGNETEIDFLNGEIVRLATALKAEVPLNRAVVDLVHRVEAERKGSPRLSAQQIADAIGLDLAAHRARARGRALLFALAVFALALLFFRALRR